MTSCVIKNFLGLLLVCMGMACAAKDVSALRALAEEPVSSKLTQTELRIQYEKRLQAAIDLDDYALSLSVLKTWNAALPDDKFPKDRLLAMLTDGDRYDRVITQNQIRFDAPDNRFSGPLTIAMHMYFAGRNADVSQRLAQIKFYASRAVTRKGESGWSPYRSISALLGVAGVAEIESRLQYRSKQYSKAIDAANDGIDAAQDALGMALDLPTDSNSIAPVFQAREVLAESLLQKLRAQVANRSNFMAGRTFNEYLAVARQVESHPHHFLNLGLFRLNEKKFQRAEAFFRKADQVAQQEGYEPLSYFRVECARGLVASMEGQKHWAAALAELKRLDTLAAQDETLRYRIRLRMERAYAYIRNGVQLEDAIALVAELKERGGGIYRAHAQGMRGVAMWKLGADKDEALVLLKEAMDIYMNPIYFDDASLGISTDVRDLVAKTYLEVAFAVPGADRLDAMVVAEWVKSSSVQSALADAAVRMSVKSPQLAEMVRRDQDLKLEIRTLLASATSDGDSSLDSKVNGLNLMRLQIQEEIKARFPEYERLTAQKPLDTGNVFSQLRSDEVMVMLLPTEERLFIWALGGNGGVSAVSAAVSEHKLAKLVANVRASVVFPTAGAQQRGQATSSFADLYDAVLRPVQDSLQGKKHLIVAAGGVLGQIPFGVLATRKPKDANDHAAWLIADMAISHIPSLNSWLAVKQVAAIPSAPEAMVGWGDPQFAKDTLVARSSTNIFRNIDLDRPARDVAEDVRAAGTTLRYADIPALPETRDELLALAQVLQADPAADLHMGADATRESVLQSSSSGVLGRKRVVAFATHGLMAGDLPNLMQPALALAPVSQNSDDYQSALLTLDDVLGLQLNADWVILSACNSAAADGRAEESLSGLARGFFYAGTRSLLVTHWAVESMSAKLLTTKTLEHYTSHPNHRKAESLRQAMLEVMRMPAYAHPAYWGPFVVVGDGTD